MFSFKKKFWGKTPLLVAGAIATAALVGWTACGSPMVRADEGKAAGKLKQAPDFSLKDIDGRTVHLSDYRGKVVVLDFWATWCGPCKIEIPWFQEFERKQKDQGFAVLGVAMDDEGWDVVKPFLKELNVNYRVMMGDDKTADQYGGIEALPTTFLIDRDGRIVSTHVGLTAKEEFEDAINQLISNPAKQKSASASDPKHNAFVGMPGIATFGAGSKANNL